MRSPLLLTLLATLPAAVPAETIDAAHGLQFRRFAQEPMLKNTVAVGVDEEGRVYATSVVRRKAADLDIRQFRAWIETDLSLTSVDAKRAFYRRELAPGRNKHKRVGDQNKDGSIDWKDLTVLSDRIIRLTDTDGDGVADEAVTFAEGFQTEVTGIAAGVTAWDGTVYATVEPDVWALEDTDRDGVADRRESLATGFSVHIAYAGHNFSGPVVGPDGRLYFSSADKGMKVTSREGVTFAHPHSGTIARCELDGSHFEVFASGLRNVQEPAFDEFGNLFGVDNDGDMKGEKERFLYIVEGSDTGWRCNWQYRRGDYNPWIEEGLHVPAHPAQPAFIVPCLRTYRDGPTGFAYNPGTALNERYRRHFFMSGFPARKLYAFTVEADGPSFAMKDEHTVGSGILMTGLNFGPDGALYIADWSAKGYELNEKGGVWTLDDPSERGSETRRATAKLIAADWSRAGGRDLGNHLGHPDQRVRMKAQFELAKRGEIEPFKKVLRNVKQPRLGRLHATWGIGQLTRHRETGPGGDPLAAAWTDPDPEIRAQAAKTAGEAPFMRAMAAPVLTGLLADRHDRPRFFAAIALGRLEVAAAVDPLVAYLARDGAHPYHRHAGMMGLLGCATPPRLAALATHESKPVRLAAVVALRRLRSPEVAVFLADADPDVVAEAAGAIHDDESIPGAFANLASLLREPSGHHDRTLRRALSAAQRLRSADAARRVAQFAASSQPAALRLAALRLLETWPRPPKLDSVEGRFRPLPPADPAAIARDVAEPFATLLAEAEGQVLAAARRAAATYGIGGSAKDLLARVRANAPDSADAMRLLAAVDREAWAGAISVALDSPRAALRAEGLRALAAVRPADFALAAAKVLEDGELIEQRRALELLGASGEPRAAELLRGAVEALAAGSLPPELQLEVLEAAAASGAEEVMTALKAHERARNPADPLAPYLETLRGGDAARGRSLFNHHLAAQCVRCHAVGSGGAAVGPNLDGIGAREPRYLLESLVDPNAVVAPGFGVTSITLRAGETLTGTLAAEDDSTLTLVLADGSRRTVTRAEVASQTPPASSMPPMGLILTKRELRDLNAYLQALK